MEAVRRICNVDNPDVEWQHRVESALDGIRIVRRGHGHARYLSEGVNASIRPAGAVNGDRAAFERGPARIRAAPGSRRLRPDAASRRRVHRTQQPISGCAWHERWPQTFTAWRETIATIATITTENLIQEKARRVRRAVANASCPRSNQALEPGFTIASPCFTVRARVGRPGRHLELDEGLERKRQVAGSPPRSMIAAGADDVRANRFATEAVSACGSARRHDVLDDQDAIAGASVNPRRSVSMPS